MFDETNLVRNGILRIYSEFPLLYNHISFDDIVRRSKFIRVDNKDNLVIDKRLATELIHCNNDSDKEIIISFKVLKEALSYIIPYESKLDGCIKYLYDNTKADTYNQLEKVIDINEEYNGDSFIEELIFTSNNTSFRLNSDVKMIKKTDNSWLELSVEDILLNNSKEVFGKELLTFSEKLYKEDLLLLSILLRTKEIKIFIAKNIKEIEIQSLVFSLV